MTERFDPSSEARSGTVEPMTPETSERVWVLEALRDTHSHERWVLDDLEDEVVRQHLGWLPEGLWDANESLLAHIREHYGIEIALQDFKQVIIGREQR